MWIFWNFTKDLKKGSFFWNFSKITFFQTKRLVGKWKLSMNMFLMWNIKTVFFGIKRHLKEFVDHYFRNYSLFKQIIVNCTWRFFNNFFFRVAFSWKNSFKDFQILTQQAFNVFLSNESKTGIKLKYAKSYALQTRKVFLLDTQYDINLVFSGVSSILIQSGRSYVK